MLVKVKKLRVDRHYNRVKGLKCPHTVMFNYFQTNTRNAKELFTLTVKSGCQDLIL